MFAKIFKIFNSFKYLKACRYYMFYLNFTYTVITLKEKSKVCINFV